MDRDKSYHRQLHGGMLLIRISWDLRLFPFVTYFLNIELLTTNRKTACSYFSIMVYYYYIHNLHEGTLYISLLALIGFIITGDQ